LRRAVEDLPDLHFAIVLAGDAAQQVLI
jgi:hypothetical protein